MSSAAHEPVRHSWLSPSQPDQALVVALGAQVSQVLLGCASQRRQQALSMTQVPSFIVLHAFASSSQVVVQKYASALQGKAPTTHAPPWQVSAPLQYWPSSQSASAPQEPARPLVS